MSVAALARRVFGQQISDFVGVIGALGSQVPRRYRWKLVQLPKPGENGKSYRRIVHFKDEYTVEPLQVTNLGGRDPVTGAVYIISDIILILIKLCITKKGRALLLRVS